MNQGSELNANNFDFGGGGVEPPRRIYKAFSAMVEQDMQKGGILRGTYQAVQSMKGLQKIHTLSIVPRKGDSAW